MRIYLLSFLSVCFFAANALFCRLALVDAHMDPESFTFIRVFSAALTLWVCVRLQGHKPLQAGSWRAAFALFVYMAAFSWGLTSVSAAIGTLVITVAVQASMLGIALWRGEAVGLRKIGGVLVGISGIAFLFPQSNPLVLFGFDSSVVTASSPSLLHMFFMLCAGIGWGFYSFYGHGITHAAVHTAGNFLRCLPFTAILLCFATMESWQGVGFALMSGIIASAFGYMVWYELVKNIRISTAAVLQLAVPPIAMFGGMIFLDEAITWRYIVSTCITLLGIAYAVTGKKTIS